MTLWAWALPRLSQASSSSLSSSCSTVFGLSSEEQLHIVHLTAATQSMKTVIASASYSFVTVRRRKYAATKLQFYKCLSSNAFSFLISILLNVCYRLYIRISIPILSENCVSKYIFKISILLKISIGHVLQIICSNLICKTSSDYINFV